MAERKKVRVAVNGYGVIGKRVADAVTRQDNMELVGVVDVVSDWRARVATERHMRLFAANPVTAEISSTRSVGCTGSSCSLPAKANRASQSAS